MNKDCFSFPLLHDPMVNDRVFIETVEGWQILGPNRNSAAYEGFFRRGDTPLQFLYLPHERLRQTGACSAISILTPCLATDGRFEVVIGEAPPIRKCCFKCVRDWVKKCAKIAPPSHNEWIAYMLLECYSYMHGNAPKEPSRG